MWSRTVREMQMPPGSANRLQPRGDVDAVAVDVVPIDDHVAEIDPDAECDALVLGDFGIAVDHRPLNLDGAAHRVDHARKFHQHAVAGGLDDPAVMLLDFRIDELAAMRLEPVEGAFLVRSHQPRVARHIGGEDRRETAGGSHARGVARPPAPVADVVVNGCLPLGHPGQPRYFEALVKHLRVP